MKSKLLLSVFILTAMCAFAQNETRRFSERENHRERESQSTFFSLRENTKPEMRRNRMPITTLQSAVATHRLDSAVFVGVQNKTKREFTYDDNGNLTIRISHFWNNNTQTGSVKDEDTFDDNGNHIRWINYIWENNAWVERWKSEFVYNDNGNLIESVFHRWVNNAWREESKSKRTYDDNGNLIISIAFWWENNAWRENFKNTYTYDDDGNMIMRTMYDWNRWGAWTLLNSDKFTYIVNENLITRISYRRWYWEEWGRATKDEYTFDNNGNMIMEIRHFWENNAWIEYRRAEYVFDNNGNMTMERHHLWNPIDDMWMGWKTVYEFDLSVSSDSIIWHFEDEMSFNNKVVRARHYEWVEENVWQENGVTTFYYSPMPNNTPTIPTNSISIFPNPASEHFTISGITENALVTVSSLTGQIVLQQTVLPNESVSVNHLPAGIYIVNVNGQSQRLIVR